LARLRFRVLSVANSYDAGLQLAAHRPVVIVVDFAIGANAGLAICQGVRRTPAIDTSAIYAVEPADCPLREQDRVSINGSYARPFDLGLLVKRIEWVIEFDTMYGPNGPRGARRRAVGMVTK
jgi:hypothetical protein